MIQELTLPYDVKLCIQREDLVHPKIQGNKYRKLKYNLAFAKANSCTPLLTFGGAFSNHILATAIAGKLEGIPTVGIIRGEELSRNLSQTLAQNPTLSKAVACGMHLEFVSRAIYKLKDTQEYRMRLLAQYPNAYILPEGGTNALAIEGCKEILNQEGLGFDFVCCPVGTGGTISGIIASSRPQQKILGFPSLKGNFLEKEVKKWTSRRNWEFVTSYHFGGYAKTNETLITFINEFAKTHKIQLDPIYTGKMLYGILDLIKLGSFPAKSRILAIHTGGLQGIAGMNMILKKKGLPTIHLKE